MRMRVAMRFVVRMRVMFAKNFVGEQIIFRESLVVPVAVPATIGAAFGLELRGFLAHRHAELYQHFLQDRIGLKLKKIFPELDRRVPVSQMVCGPHQGIRRLSGNAKDIFQSRFDSDQCAVFCFQQIAVAKYRPARQEQRRFSSVCERRSKPALPPKIERQHKLWERTTFSFVYFAIGVFFDPYDRRHISKKIWLISEQEIPLRHR